MLLPTDTDLAAAVTSANRTIVSEFKVDWGRTGLYDHALSDLSSVVDSVQFDRDVSGTLPKETTIVEGFIGGRLTANLSGIRPQDTSPIAQLLSPLRADSPLYGQVRRGTLVRWRLGLLTAAGTVPMMDQFTGYIDEPVVRGDGTVTLGVIDGATKIHAPINLPLQMASLLGATALGNSQYRTNTQWVIDHVLRRNGIYQSPPAVTGALYCATGHGAMIPEIGHQFNVTVFGSCTENDPVVLPGRWGLACNASSKFLPVASARLNGIFVPVPNTSYLVQVQLEATHVGSRFIDSSGAAAESLFLISSGRGLFDGTTWVCGVRQTGQLYCQFYNGTTLVQTVNGPGIGGPGWQDVFFIVEFNGMTNASVSFPNETHSGVDLSGLSSTPNTWYNSFMQTWVALPMQGLQVSVATGGFQFYDPAFVSQCSLDPGLNEILSLPVRRGVDSLDLLREVVQSEFGVAGFNESGQFFFRNRRSIRRSGLVPTQELTPDPSLITLTVSEPPGSVRNVVTTNTQVLRASSSQFYKEVFSLRNPEDILVPNAGYSFWRLALDKTAGFVDDFGSLTFVNTATWNSTNLVAKYCAVDYNNTEISNLGVDVIADPVALAAGKDEILLRVNNPNNFVVKFMTSDGRPALTLQGLPMEPDSEIVNTYRRQSSIDKFGQQVYPIEHSDWRQLIKPMRGIALDLLKDLKTPLPAFNQITAVGDPRRQLNDTVSLSDPQGLGGPVVVGIERISRVLAGGKLSDDLTVRMFSRPGSWLLGVPGSSELGVTTILG